MVPERHLAAQISVLHQVSSAPSWPPKIATFPESVFALDDPPLVACCDSPYRFMPCSTFERMGCISETTDASPFAKLAVI